MLSVLRVHLPSDIPIAGCELSPYVLLRKADGTITTDDIPEGNPQDGFYIRYRWYDPLAWPFLFSSTTVPGPFNSPAQRRGWQGASCFHPELPVPWA